jgi:hypothetical protein
VKFSDREARDLVAVRMAHEYYGVTPEVAMNWRSNGANVKTIMTREYHTRHQDDAHQNHGHQNGHGGDPHGARRDNQNDHDKN